MEPDDARGLLELFRASVREIARRDYSEAEVRAWAPDEIDETEWSLKRAAVRTWVAEIDGSCAGFVDLADDGRLGMLFVHPRHQHQAVAAALMAHLERHARASAMRRLHTEASITARGFFEHQGFRVVAPQTVFLRGRRFLNFRMEKSLDPCAAAAGDTRD